MSIQRVLGSVFVPLSCGGNGKKMMVEVSNLIIVSNERSEEEVRRLDVDEIVRRHLYDVAQQRDSFPGFCRALEERLDTILGKDLYLCKRDARVRATLKAVAPEEIDASRAPEVWSLRTA